jgi:hypothetical protein
VVTFLNGAFGIGKSTVARSLRGKLPKTVIYDPEIVGFVLRRLPRWVPLKGRDTGDYQDMPLWRELTVSGIRLARVGWQNIIVPMAFSNFSYLSSVREKVRKYEPEIHHFCLVAPFEAVEERLLKRGSDPVSSAWEFRRARECCEAHAGIDFREHVPTAQRSVDAVVEDLLSRLSANCLSK